MSPPEGNILADYGKNMEIAAGVLGRMVPWITMKMDIGDIDTAFLEPERRPCLRKEVHNGG